MSMGFYDIQIMTFRTGAFNQFNYLPRISASSLKILNIQENQFQDIDSLGKDKYPCLQKIVIELNKIRKLPAIKAFNLSQIQIDSNLISSIQIFASASYPNLKILDLYNNKITELPLIKAPSLTFIGLISNQITTIQQFAKGVYPQLVQIDISKNKLKYFPQINAQKLEKVQAGNNQLKNINDFAQGNNMRLKQIYFNKNELKYIPKFRSKNIYRAHFEHNFIQNTDFLKGEYNIVVEICFSDNNLTSFSQITEYLHRNNSLKINNSQGQFDKKSSIKKQQQEQILFKQKLAVKMLIVDNNPLKSISFIDFKHLKTFSARNCKIESIQQFSKGVYHDLQMLTFSQNFITTLPKLNSLNLVDLRLESNSIQNVNEFFSVKYQNLTTLYLSKNKIKYLPRLESDNVNFMSFSQNPLKGFEDEFFQYSYKRVEWIEFSIQNQNRLIDLINSFQRLYTVTFPVSYCEWQILSVAGLFQEESQSANLSKYQLTEYLINVHRKLKERKYEAIQQKIADKQQE